MNSAGTAATVNVLDSNVPGTVYGIYRSAGTVNLTYSNVWGNTTANLTNVTGGTGYLSCNPLYVGAPANYRLTSNSPSRNAGDTGADLGPLPYVSDATPGLYGTLWTNTTVTAGTTAVAGDLTVPSGVTLTLSPGAKLQFAGSDIMACGVDATRPELTVEGSLNSTGTSGQHVALTATASSAGTWSTAWCSPRAQRHREPTLQYTDIDKAAYGVTYSATATSNTIANDTVSTCTYGVYVTTGSPAMDAMLVQTSSYGISVVGGAGLALTNAIIQGCTSDGLYVTSSSGSPTIGVMNCTINGDGTVGINSAGDGGHGERAEQHRHRLGLRHLPVGGHWSPPRTRTCAGATRRRT